MVRYSTEEPGGKYRLDMSVPYDKSMMELTAATLRDFIQFNN